MQVLGIDISKATFDVTLLTSERKHRQFANQASGFEQLAKWLTTQKAGPVHACMEATNIYWEALALYLHEAGHRVSVVNPARIKGFAQSQLQRTKTDKQDSWVIATFCAQTTPDGWTPPSESERKLRALVRHREALQKTRTQQKNRIAHTTDDDVQASLQTLIDTLSQQIQEIERKIREHLDQHADIAQKAALLCSIPGIGETTAHMLLAEFYDLDHYESAKAAAADAGLTPAQHESGTSVRRRPRLSKVGKASVRAALYWPAITAIRFNPTLMRFAQRLRDKGKPQKLIIAAVMRKLLHIAYGVLKHHQPFDPTIALRLAPT